MLLLGWFGSIIMAISSVPQMVKTVRDGHADGLSWAFLGLWLIGEIMSLVYIAPSHNWPLVANYTLNLGIILVMLCYKIWPRSSRRVNIRQPLSRGEINELLRQIK